MATTSTTVFSDYVTEGSKLESFKSFFDAYESVGQKISTAKGIVSQVSSIGDTVRESASSAASSVSSKITASLKKLGLTDKSISMLNSATGGLLSSSDSFLMSLYDTVESYASSVIGDVLTELKSLYLPESTFLWSIKALAAAGSDPNYNSVLRTVAIEHDLVDTLKWLDDYNDLSYDIDTEETSDVYKAAKGGSFQVATYIMKELKTEYKKLSTLAVLSDDDQKALDVLKFRYVTLFNKVIRYIFVYSYDNLTTGRFKDILDSFSTFIPASLGTSDKTYSKRDLITSSDIDKLAPFYIVDTGYTKKTYIDPRNQNIKKLYVWLAFSTDYDDSNRLIHKALHTRLKYPIITTLLKARYAAEKTLRNSALGKYIAKVQENYAALIANYIEKIEGILFNPKKQAYLQGSDTTIIPSYRGETTTSTADEKDTTDSLPFPTLFAKYYISYTDFSVYLVDPTYTAAQIAEDSVSTIRSSSVLKYVEDYVIAKYDATSDTTSNETYLLFHSAKAATAFTSMTASEKDYIIRCILAKYFIDYYYTTYGYTLDAIAVMYPSLNTDGLLNLFSEYVSAITTTTENTATTDDGNGGTIVDGSYVNYSSLAFYSKVLSDDGTQIAIEDSGINIYDANGEKTGTYGKAQGITSGTPQGIAVKGSAIFIYVLNSDGTVSVWVSTDGGLTFTLDSSVNGDALSIYAGTGITDITQINFFKTFYYNSKIFTATDTGIGITESGSTSYITTNEGLATNSILGIAFMPDGKLYYLCTIGVYQIPDYTARPVVQVKVGEYAEDRYTLIEDQIGTILIVASINVENVDDFDIDDEETIASIISYYKSKNYVYYIFGTIAADSTSGDDDKEPEETAGAYSEGAPFTEYVAENTKTDTTEEATPVFTSFEEYLASCEK